MVLFKSEARGVRQTEGDAMVKAVIGVMGFGDEGIRSKRILAATRS